MLNQSQICNTAVLVLLCYKIWIRSSPDQSWQAFQTGYRLREAMSPKLDLAGIPERRDTVVLGSGRADLSPLLRNPHPATRPAHFDQTTADGDETRCPDPAADSLPAAAVPSP